MIAADVGVLDLALLLAVLVVAVVAVVAPRRTAATSAFLVFGIVAAVLWARLGAPDVALAEAALGGGVAGALLVDAIADRRPPVPAAGTGARRRVLVVGALAGAATAVALGVAVSALPAERSPLADDVAAAMPDSGVEHPVTAVLLNFRSYDTLLEIAVLVAAAVGVTGLARRRVPAPAAPSPAVRVLAVVLLPVLALLSTWLLVAGTTRPGGAFQAGALLGAALVVAHLAGVRIAGPRGRIGAVAVVAGLLAFLVLAGATAVTAGGWLVLEASVAGALILAVETLLALSIAAGLAAMFLAAGADTDLEVATPGGAS
ncbi:hydrogen gas-evolving membrane-bound hydrogenase subunit E [Serinibacter arcticus]|uniref:hydrogen gas-evolving membrane-bound hydrogenase subunit E n=1 Tax=Serinibacter arcticus TaxID=1655435 RepID=UPI000D65609C|nr:hydrogen gas-evolving membrane-bound hydrogenase subunit E [Serinibacter arcticus]